MKFELWFAEGGKIFHAEVLETGTVEIEESEGPALPAETAERVFSTMGVTQKCDDPEEADERISFEIRVPFSIASAILPPLDMRGRIDAAKAVNFLSKKEAIYILKCENGTFELQECHDDSELTEVEEALINGAIAFLETLSYPLDYLKVDTNAKLQVRKKTEIEAVEPAEELRDFVPQGWLEKYHPRRVSESVTDLDIVVEALAEREHTLLEGPTGCGKNHLFLAAAERLNMPCVSISLNGMTTAEDLIGRWVLKDGHTEFIEGIFVRFFRLGGLVVLDEINAAPPEVLFVLHQALDDRRLLVLTEKDGEVVHAHPDFVVGATMNPGYIGTIELNKALRNRFAVKLMCLPNYDFERTLLTEQLGASVAEAVIKVVRESRSKMDNGVSTRTIINFCKLAKKYPAVLAAQLAGFSPEEAEMIKSAMPTS